MDISPDGWIFWRWGPVVLNGTILFTWGLMALLVLGSWLVTRKITTGRDVSRWQLFLETVVSYIRKEIENIIHKDPDPYLPFVGTLFLYISVSNLLAIVPKYQPPTGSISTTAALAVCVFFAVPVYGISQAGLKIYFKHYIRPSVFMLPFNVIGEFSRTLALAVRLFGNVMSGTLIVAIILSIAPLFVPIVMQALGLLIGQIQAYIFAILATVYIASATRAFQEKDHQENQSEKEE
jgi:F-type H+-transporting ATPase subunit a